jgi:hypothetical protein
MLHATKDFVGAEIKKPHQEPVLIADKGICTPWPWVTLL